MSRLVEFPRQMQVHCHACRTRGDLRSAEARGERLPDDQAREAVRLHQAGKHPACPHDATPLSVRENHGLAGKLTYKVLCLRCGADGQIVWS